MKLTPNKLVQVLSPIYSSDRKIPTVMLWGQPGVGKSDAIRSLAKNLEKTTKKEVRIQDVRLLLFNPVDLRGIPVADANKEFAIWLKPKIFDMDASDKIINILFLDEISAAPPTVQASAYQLTLDRKVGEHKLPDNCIILGAGNRVGDKGVAYKMPTPLANRMMSF
jgi:MoxR-like ATPase